MRRGRCMMARNKFDVDEVLESPFQWSPSQACYRSTSRRHRVPDAAGAGALRIWPPLPRCSAPSIMEWVLDDAVPNKDVQAADPAGQSCSLYLILISIVFTTIRSRIMAYVSQEIIYDIRKDLFRSPAEAALQLLRQPSGGQDSGAGHQLRELGVGHAVQRHHQHAFWRS